MKLLFGWLRAVLYPGLVPGLAMANENEQHLGSTSPVIPNKNLRSTKENIYSSPTLFSTVKGTNTYKNLSHQAYVRDETNRMENDKSIRDSVGDGVGVGGTDNDLNTNTNTNTTNLAKYYQGLGQLDDRYLQMELPDYTSPPLPVALAVTPEPYRDDEMVEEARDLAAGGNCTIDGNRCHIPFPVINFSDKFEGPNSGVGVVFYNGGRVDPRGYAPIANILNERYGIPVVMPIFAADLAFTGCDSGRLAFAKAEFPKVQKWVLAGHSFGGVAASADFLNSLTNTVDDSVAGLVLLAADVQGGIGCGDTDFADRNIPMAQVLAANDGVLNMTRANLNRARNSENAIFFVEITGANHASFGAYDSSERFALFGQIDGEQLIPSEIVWDIAASAIANVAARTGVGAPTKKKNKKSNKSKKTKSSKSTSKS